MEDYLKSKLGYSSVRSSHKSSGGDISQGTMYITDRGKIFVKSNHKSGSREMFEGEFASLKAIMETGTIKVPQPIDVLDNPQGPGCLIVMEYLDMEYPSQQALLGTQLAKLHLHNKEMRESGKPWVEKFGFDVPTCCGYLPQGNKWNTSWPEFYTNKLQEQVDRLKDGSDAGNLMELWSKLKQKIPDLFAPLTEEIVPALVHGDLWSGNVGQVNGQPAVYDAASFYGHHEYDLGIAGMFGGFSRDFHKAYHSLIPKAPGFEERHSLYQLFHYLNHWAHFGGGGYRGTSLRIINQLVK